MLPGNKFWSLVMMNYMTIQEMQVIKIVKQMLDPIITKWLEGAKDRFEAPYDDFLQMAHEQITQGPKTRRITIRR